MERSVEKVRERLIRAAACLTSAGVPYAVVGGNAVAAWVARVDESAVRNTRDVDVLLRRSDLDAARTALEGAGFIYRRVASLGKAGTMEIFLDGHDAKAGDAIHVVLAGEKVTADSVEPAPDVSESEQAGNFRLISLEALVRMKLTSFRDKDRVHLRDLAGVGLIDHSWASRYPASLCRRLLDVLNDPDG